jgi:hypothetical protein
MVTLRFDVFYGIFSFALGGYLLLLADRDIILNGYGEVFNVGGLLTFVGFLLMGLGLFLIVSVAFNARKI